MAAVLAYLLRFVGVSIAFRNAAAFGDESMVELHILHLGSFRLVQTWLDGKNGRNWTAQASSNSSESPLFADDLKVISEIKAANAAAADPKAITVPNNTEDGDIQRPCDGCDPSLSLLPDVEDEAVTWFFDAHQDPLDVFRDPADLLLPPELKTGERGAGAKALGITANSAGDFAAFLTAITYNCLMMLACLSLFSALRKRFPLIYENNILEDVAPQADSEGWFGWIRASLATTTEQQEESVGLDCAMLLEFPQLCMRILRWIGFPMILIMGPLVEFFGDKPRVGENIVQDKLNIFSMANVAASSWLYWIYAVIIWGVVLIVIKFIFDAQAEFLKRRAKWLQQMPPPRSTTIMVESIPSQYQSDEQLKAFFADILGSVHVKKAWVAKRAPRLTQLIQQRTQAEKALASATFEWKNTDEDPAKRPKTSVGQDSIEFYTQEVAHIQEQISDEKASVEEWFSTTGGVNGSNGFVTFTDPWHAQLALNLQYDTNAEFWAVSCPPPPASVLWHDLEQDPEYRAVYTIVGYFLTALLFICYLPIIVWISRLATMVNFKSAFVQSIWGAFAPTIGLQIMVAMLPTLLMIIFRSCFTLVDAAMAQVHLQRWYFAFQTVFVILITAIGPSIPYFAVAFVERPIKVLKIFAVAMPKATHFYLNYQVLAWATHAVELLRLIPFFKYLAYATRFDPEDARALAEPEDQDYYGIGSRHARWTNMMSIGIIYSTLSPWIAVSAFVNFAVCRLIFGYLIPFAETKKADLGGVFWVQTLDQLFVALIIYSLLMTMVLVTRCSYSGPDLIALPTLVYVCVSWVQFHIKFVWQKLPASKLKALRGQSGIDKADMVSSEGEYVQPEWVPAKLARGKSFW